MKKLNELYRGKAKTLFKTDIENCLVVEFRDDISAFDAKKISNLKSKGYINNKFNEFIMNILEKKNIKTNFLKRLDSRNSLFKRLKMFPIECVVRNFSAGSICKRLGIKNGKKLNPPIMEFFFKDDSLGDPLVNESHIINFNWCSKFYLEKIKKLSLKVNGILYPYFFSKRMILVDYKLEFGLYKNKEVILGDEFTPDSCRLWDLKSKVSYDKDIFRNDLGDVIDGYKEASKRIGIKI